MTCSCCCSNFKMNSGAQDAQTGTLLFESFGGFGKGVGEILWKAANVLQNKLTRAQYLDEVTWTTKNWLGLQKQRISVVLHTAIAEQIDDCE